jgi:hypothetical protein
LANNSKRGPDGVAGCGLLGGAGNRNDTSDRLTKAQFLTVFAAATQDLYPAVYGFELKDFSWI